MATACVIFLPFHTFLFLENQIPDNTVASLWIFVSNNQVETDSTSCISIFSLDLCQHFVAKENVQNKCLKCLISVSYIRKMIVVVTPLLLNNFLTGILFLQNLQNNILSLWGSCRFHNLFHPSDTIRLSLLLFWAAQYW